MHVVVKYFGMLSETTHCDEEKIQIQKNTVGEILNQLIKKYPSLEKQKFNVAVNHIIVENTVNVNAEDEIALLPPFAGG